MAKHSKPKTFGPINLLSRRRAILTILFGALMTLFVVHQWVILSILFALLTVFELFLAVETAGAEGAVGKEQEIAMAGLAKLAGAGGENSSGAVALSSLFDIPKHTKDDDKLNASKAFDGYL